MDGKIIIATHGAGRGRDSTFLPLLLQHIMEHWPALTDKIELWHTGTPRPALDGVRAIVFILADPLSHHSMCEGESRALAKTARDRGIRLFNPPDALNNTVKSRQAEIWNTAGLPCASGAAANNEAELRALLRSARYPVVLRSNDRHVQLGATVCEEESEALGFLATAEYPVAMIEFIDTRESWRRQQPGTVFATYFHKRRSMVFGSRVINNHIFFSEDPIVGGKTSTFLAAARGVKKPGMKEMLRIDFTYSRAPPEAPALMRAAMRALGLDVAAIDYSSRADGSIILWEANPFFHLPHWSEGLLGAPRRLQERVPRMLNEFVEELLALIEVPCDG
jgi:hypothetical protein